MAKKETKGDQLNLDSYDFGSEFDFDEFDLQPKPVKTKREAVERVAGAAWDAGKETIKSPSFFREMIRKALPTGYGNMLNVADQAASTIRGLYNEGAKELKPAMKETAKVLDRLMPEASKHLPKEAQGLLRRFVEANKDKPQVGVGGQSAADMAVAGILQDTFKYNAQAQAKREAKDDAREGIRDAINNNRHQDQIGQLDGIRHAVVSMAAYQKRIEFGYQRKSLELQARQYFVAVDLLNETKRQNVRNTEMLQGILTNTSLPDLIKIRTSEKMKDMFRNKIIGGLQDGIFGQRGNYFERLGAAFKEQAMGSVRNLASGIRDGAEGIQMAQDQADMAAEMGVDRFKAMGMMLGSTGANWIGGLGASKLGKAINTTTGGRAGKIAKKVRKVGNDLQFAAENAPQLMTDWSNRYTDVGSDVRQALDNRTNLGYGAKSALSGIAGFIGDPIMDLFKGTVRRANAQDTQVKSTGITDMHAPAAFSNQAHRSLVDVIPGYLARILQEQQIARTGDTSIDLTSYDFAKGTFTSNKALKTAIFNRLFDQRSKEGVKYEQDRLLELVDPTGKLNAKQRAELSKILMNDNLRGRAGYETGKITNYTNDYNFGDSKHGKKYAELFKELNKKRLADGEGNVDNDFAARFRNVGRSAAERRPEIQQLLEVYPRELLEEMGLIDANDRVNMSQVTKYFAGEKYNARGQLAQGGLRRLPGGRAAPQLPAPSGSAEPQASDEVVSELQKLIELIETQNTKPLVSDIKDILEKMREELANLQVSQGESGLDRAMNAAGELGQGLRRGANRARRMAQVRGARLMQQSQPQLDAMRQQGADFLEEAQRRALRARRQAQVQAGRLRQNNQGRIDQAQAFVDSQLQRGQELWNDRPSLEQLRDMLTERLGEARGRATGTINSLRQTATDWRTRAAGAFAARREQTNERISEGGLEKTNGLLGEIKETLEGIQARLDDGIMTIDAAGVPQGVLGRIRGAAGRAGGAARRGLSRLNMRISDMVKLGWNAGTGLAKFGGSAANWLVGGTVRGVFKAGIGAAGMAGDVASTVAGNAYRRARGFVDIYVGNERKPRMYGRMLQEGNVYFNRDTNKPIRTFKDITGTVVKRSPDGTEEVVLEENEIEQAYQRQGPVKKFIKTMGAGVKFAAKIGNGLVGGLLGAIPPVYRLAWGAGKKAWTFLLDAPQDIFVKDKLDEPVMLARIMRAGGYQSAVSGKIIKRPSQIDGPVVSAEETVLTHDDIRKGLVDKNNKPIRTGLSKLLNFAFGGAKRAAKLAWAIGKKVNQAGQDLVKGGLTLGKNILKTGVKVGGGVFDLARGRNPFAKGVQAADLQTVQVAAESNSLLKEIRDILKDRLPERKKHKAADANDDGIRDGSYEDQMAKKAEADKAKAEQAAQAKGKDGVSGDPGMLSKLWAKLRGKKDEDDEDDDDSDINIDLGGDKDKARAAKRARRLKRAQPKGFWNKTKALGKRGLKGLKGLKAGRLLGMGGKLLGGVGTAYGAYSTYEALKEGRYGDAAVDGALTVGGAALTGGGIMSGLAAAGSTLGAIGAGIAGVISAPVLLGAAAVAAVGVGGYFAYKYLTKKKLGLLSRIRYAQYGFIPTDSDHTNAVFGLEDKLKDAIIYGKEGAKLDAKRVDPKALLKDFDVDEKDTKALNNWLSWFSTRFKPVFLTHVSALKGIAGDKWLSDVDDLDPPVALKYLNATRFPEGPYGQDVSPFKDLKSLPAGGGDVRELLKIAETELQKKVKDSAGKPGVGGATVAATTAAAAGAAAATPTQNAQVGTTPSGISKQVLSQAAASAGVGLPPAKGGQVGVAGSNTVLNSLGADRLDGLDVVRLKTYGLVKMEVDKVRALQALEKTVQSNLSYNKDVAKWTGSLEQLLNVSGPAFGVDISNEALASNWLNWFNMRFLPTYLNYATLMKAQTGKDDPADGKLALKPTQVVDVATGVFTTSGSGGSVWNISTSPWDEYELNSDVRSTDGNMQGLKDMAKNAVLPEPGNKSANQPTANKSAANSSAFNGTPKLGGAMGWAWNSVKSAAGSVVDSVKSVFSSGPPVGGTANGPGGFEGGRQMDHPGKGTGGDINDIPAPKGNKSWQALKDTIMGAAKMVGVDGKLMAAMAAIESGFNYAVKAGSSSATGLFQFIDSTWQYMLKHFGPKYGIAPGTPASDPRANALMGGEYIKMNLGALDGQIGRPVTDTDIYMAHFLGSGGARKFLKSDPNAIASQVMPDAARANPTIFYDKTGAPRTIGQVYQLMQDRLKNRASSFGVNDGGEAMVDSAKSTAAGAKPGDVPPATEAGGKAPAKAPATAGTAPATAAAAPKTSSYGVGSTAPATAGSGAAPAPVATTAPAANDPAQAGPQNRGVPIGVLASGFAPPRSMADQMNQARQMNEVRITNLTDTNELLKTANETQGKILGVLQSIDGKIGGLGQAAPQSKPTEATPSSQAARQVERRTTELPRPPVSVARPRAPGYGG